MASSPQPVMATDYDPQPSQPANEEVFPEEVDEAAEETEHERLRREREARAQALTLEIVGDLPFAEVKPPENVLFVCKLNPVTEDEDLHTIFSRFGPIVSCEVIRDKRTRDSLQYAFIEYENQKDCEQAYFKMPGVLIDDHRIHVDFSQSVSRVADVWRNKTNANRKQHGGGFGGVAGLEKKRQYRKMEVTEGTQDKSNGYGMVFDKGRDSEERDVKEVIPGQKMSRSRSPRERRVPNYRDHEDDWRRSRSRDRRRYDDRQKADAGRKDQGHDRDQRREQDRHRDFPRDGYEDRRRRR